MRTQITILLIPLFLVIFLIAITANQVASTIASEDLIVKVLDDAEVYEYVYDDLLERISRDVIDREYEIDLGNKAFGNASTLKIDDVELGSNGITHFVDDVLPLEYVRGEVSTNLGLTLAYIRGDRDDFVSDLGVQDRIRQVPSATESLFGRTEFSEELVSDLILPSFRTFNSDVLESAFGLGFSDDETEDVALLLFAPEWLESNTVDATEEIAHYFSGDADEFEYVLRLEDRVVIAGEILKNKLRNEDVLYQLVFTHMVQPLLGQVVGLAHSAGFGITLTNQEVGQVLELIAPREWVREQGDGMMDELVAYLVSATDGISYTVELEERKDAASFALTELVVAELRGTLQSVPSCQTQEDLELAAADIANRSAPRCLAGGQESIDAVLDSLTPILRAEVQHFVATQVPNELHYSQEFFEASIGGNSQILSNVRTNIRKGVKINDDDLLGSITSMSDSSTNYQAQRFVDFISDGVIFTDADILADLNSATQEQVKSARGYVATAMGLRWLVWPLIILPLILLAYLAADSWSARLKWAGTILALAAVVTYVSVSLVWSTYLSPVIVDALPTTESMGESLEENFPRLADELNNNGPTRKIEEIIIVWQESLKDQAVPWIFLGILMFAAGTGLPNTSGSYAGNDAGKYVWKDEFPEDEPEPEIDGTEKELDHAAPDSESHIISKPESA